MKKIFIFAAATLALTACDSNDDNPGPSSVAAKVTATIGESAVSRVVDNAWNEDDSIGISSTVGNVAGPYINVKYITENGDGNFKGTQLFFYKPMTLTAYYPFKGTEGIAPGTAGVVEENTRPDNQKPEHQPGIDFLWDSKTGFTAANPNVNFNFAHKMSKVTFIFQSSEAVKIGDQIIAGPVDVNDMVNYTINELVLDGTFDTKTGVCAVKTDAPAEPLSIAVANVQDNKAVLPVIIFPQTLKGGSTTLDIYTDELRDLNNLQHYKCSLAFSDGEIKPGYHYIYTIKVTKIGLIVGKMTVEPWEVEDRSMTATIDGDDVFNE